MILYLVKLVSKDKSEQFYKVGVTSSNVESRFAYGKEKIIDSKMLSLREKVEKRLAGQIYVPDMPYDVTNIHTVSYNLEGDALISESELLTALRTYQYWPQQPFSGRSECFTGENLEQTIITFMNSDSEERNIHAPTALKYKLAEIQVKQQYADPIEKHKAVLNKCRKLYKA